MTADEFNARMSQIVKLPPDWSSHGSEAIDNEAASLAVAVADAMASIYYAYPTPVPTEPGGVQLEYRTAHMHIEVEVYVKRIEPSGNPG